MCFWWLNNLRWFLHRPVPQYPTIRRSTWHSAHLGTGQNLVTEVSFGGNFKARMPELTPLSHRSIPCIVNLLIRVHKMKHLASIQINDLHNFGWLQHSIATSCNQVPWYKFQTARYEDQPVEGSFILKSGPIAENARFWTSPSNADKWKEWVWLLDLRFVRDGRGNFSICYIVSIRFTPDIVNDSTKSGCSSNAH